MHNGPPEGSTMLSGHKNSRTLQWYKGLRCDLKWLWTKECWFLILPTFSYTAIAPTYGQVVFKDTCWLLQKAGDWQLWQLFECYELSSLWRDVFNKHMWSYLRTSIMDDDCIYVCHNTACYMLTCAVTKAEGPVANVTPPGEFQLQVSHHS